MNAKAVGLGCIVGKRVAQHIPGIEDVLSSERPLTREDRRFLSQVLPKLPELRIPLSEDVIDAFMTAYRALEDRPTTWEPVLITEARYAQERERRIGERWEVSEQHRKRLQQIYDEGRIAAFDRSRVPAKELVIGTLIPREHAIAYLKRCHIQYGDGGAELRTDEQAAEELLSNDAGGVEVPEIQSARSVVAPMPVAPKPVAQAPAISRGPVLRIKQVAERTSLSRATLYAMMDPKSPSYDPRFPTKIHLSSRSVGYLQSDVDAWIQGRLSAENQ
jgi:predicted DNA-binding transcriptional regulator AlpA